MRIRTVKPEFWQSEKVASVSRDARLMFIGLWGLADDHGRLRANAALIRGQLFPYDDEHDVAGWLAELVEAGLVQVYQVDGCSYAAIPGFAEHQKIDKRWDSKLPAPPEARRRGAGASANGQPARLPQTPPESGEPPQSPAEPRRTRNDRPDSTPLDQGMDQGALDGWMDGGSGSVPGEGRTGGPGTGSRALPADPPPDPARAAAARAAVSRLADAKAVRRG